MRVRILTAAVILGALASSGVASAQHTCEYPFAVYSGPGTDVNVLRCAVDSGDDLPDGRIILPGSTSISVSYLNDLGVERIYAVIDGVGFNQKRITLTRAARTGGLVTYDSPNQTLPNGRLTSGCLTVSVTFNEGTEDEYVESTAYHTVDSNC